ncbi:uncharacterized protein EKO05_0002033 [Ascochyta rabiei]|uniref:uncharacterized protein n=1 Tax=Didymella rabiei TaxID=5454 RepID=UPI00220E1C3A|nr:uncharacterized protein EKO05_0002033 [Ascochyta rabiei]UPX11427.1 hypothetical protein EKO05_0002033 [Ascochyta rabiei]
MFQFREEHYYSSATTDLRAVGSSVNTRMDDILSAKSSTRGFIKNFRKHLDDVKGKALSDSEKTETFGIPRFLERNGLTLETRHSSEMRNIIANDLQESWKDMYQGMKSTYARDNVPAGIAKYVPKYLDKLNSLVASPNKLYNAWHIDNDDLFAQTYCTESPSTARGSEVQMCTCCKRFLSEKLIDRSVDVEIASLLASAESCQVCNLLIRVSLDDMTDDGSIKFFRTRTGLNTSSSGKRLVRISAYTNTSSWTKNSVPLGRPILPDPDRTMRFHLLRAWTHWCDQNHGCNKPADADPWFPTRVLDVGGLEDIGSPPGWIRLVHAQERRSDTYVTLSHCWGNLSDAQKKGFCTSQENLSRRCSGFHVSELPKTFQDAVKVTRALGLSYVWIDSLCIIQSGDNGEDWKRESVQMQNVYSQAYLTIAATAAADSLSGFLDRNYQPEYLSYRDDTSQRLFVSTDIDDFDIDVGGAPLNQRAWVTQEMVLSRRTIYFSTKQMYWTCGEGLYCENLTKLKSPPNNIYFTLDPAFPTRVRRTNAHDRVENCIRFLVEDYTRRALTFWKDRTAAIYGLERSVAEGLRCEGRYGIFEPCLHRNLLWQLTDQKTQKIDYEGTVPSWSWMACTGPVKYSKIYWKVPVLNVNLAFHKTRRDALEADLGSLVDCALKLDRDDFAFIDSTGVSVGWLKLDVKDDESMNAALHCVVVLRCNRDGYSSDPSEYWFIAVVPTGAENEYKRVGLGAVECRFVAKVQDSVQIV